MSEIIERAAKAAEEIDPSLWVGEDKMAYYRRVARAVLETIREPTEAMVDAGCDGKEGIYGAVLIAYGFMMEEALK